MLARGEIAMFGAVLPAHFDQAPLDVDVHAIARRRELHAELRPLDADRDAGRGDAEMPPWSRRDVAIDAAVIEVERHRRRLVARHA